MVRSSKNFNNYEDWNRAAKDAGYTVRGPFTPSVGRGPSHFSAADSGGHVQGDFTPDENRGQLYMYESVDEDIQDLKRRAGIITEQNEMYEFVDMISRMTLSHDEGEFKDAAITLNQLISTAQRLRSTMPREPKYEPRKAVLRSPRR